MKTLFGFVGIVVTIITGIWWFSPQTQITTLNLIMLAGATLGGAFPLTLFIIMIVNELE